MRTKKLVLNSILVALSAIFSYVEAIIPIPLGIPGIKLGLANIVTLFALAVLGPKDALIILIMRVILGSVFSGQIITLAYSMTGGVLCLAAEAALLKVLPLKNLWAISVIGAAVHNTAQVAVAVLITKTPGIFWYLPYLIIAAVITGAFIGAAVQFTLKKGDSVIKKLTQTRD